MFNRIKIFFLKNNKKIIIFLTIIMVAVVVIEAILYKKSYVKEDINYDTPYGFRGVYESNKKVYRQSTNKSLALFVGYKAGQADYITLFVIDNKNNSVTPILINRNIMCDYYELDETGRIKGKTYSQIKKAFSNINNDFLSLSNLKDAVSNLLCNIKIDYYCCMDFNQIKPLSNLVGDVNLKLKSDCTYLNPSYEKGASIIVNSSNIEQIFLGDETRESVADIEQRENDYLAEVLLLCQNSNNQQYIKDISNKIASISIGNIKDYIEEMNRILQYNKITRVVLEGKLDGDGMIVNHNSIEEICINYIYND